MKQDIFYPEDPLIRNLLVVDIVDYLRQRRWQHIDYANENLLVFQSEMTDDSGEKIRLFIPGNDDLWDKDILLSKTINLLAMLENCSSEELLEKINKNKLRWEAIKVTDSHRYS